MSDDGSFEILRSTQKTRGEISGVMFVMGSVGLKVLLDLPPIPQKNSHIGDVRLGGNLRGIKQCKIRGNADNRGNTCTLRKYPYKPPKGRTVKGFFVGVKGSEIRVVLGGKGGNARAEFSDFTPPPQKKITPKAKSD